VLHPRLLADNKLHRRLAREAELAGRLSHPNVIGVLDIGDLEGVPFLVMELAVGPTLAELLASAPFDALRACRLIRQLCAGLSHAHGHGLIHRDLKPDNVIVEQAGGDELVRIGDFGIAILGESMTSPDRITTGGLVLGTPQYMAPEMAAGQEFDDRVDLYALGVICYEMLTGRLPFDGTNVEVVHAHMNAEVPAMATRANGWPIDPLLEALTRRLLAKHPDDRMPTAAAARDAVAYIERTLLGRPTVPMMPPRGSTPPPSGPRRPLTPPEADALGSAKTMSVAALQREQARAPSPSGRDGRPRRRGPPRR
jgi:serine/threonine-protein kinase